MHIFFATPCGRATVHNSFMTSVIQAMKLLDQFGIESSYCYVTSADIVYNRNICANQFMENPQCTHILFVDDDMVFEPKTVLKLIKADVDVVGVAAVKRELDLERFVDVCIEGAKKGERYSPMEIMSRIALFNVRPLTHQNGTPMILVEEDVLRVEAVGTGMMLIKREVFEALQKSPNVLQHGKVCAGEEKFVKNTFYGFFDKIWDEKTKTYWHEDFSFCYRWRTECNGKVHAFIDDPIGHCGDFVFIGSYLTSLLSHNPNSVQTGDEVEAMVANSKSSPVHNQEATLASDKRAPVHKAKKSARG